MICLVGIFKNSGTIIEKTLSSWLAYISCYCFADTGSTDKTMERITTICQSKTGYLFHDPFVGFSINRNRVLEEAEKRFPNHYYIMIDDSYAIMNGEYLIPYLQKNPYTYYSFYVKSNEEQFLSGRITTTGMRYKYRLHEIIDTEINPYIVPHCYILDSSDKEHNTRTKDRIKFDISQSILDCIEYKDTRCFFYYAMLLFNNQDYVNAKKHFTYCSKKSTREYEIYHSRVQLIMIDEYHGESNQHIADKYHELFVQFPYRAESLFYESLCYQRDQNHMKSIQLLEQAITIPISSELWVPTYLYEKHIPYALLRYYNVLDKEKCINLLQHIYKDPLKPLKSFDFIFESYWRCVRNPTTPMKGHINVVSYHPTGCHESYSEDTVTEYIQIVSTHTITDLVVYERFDRIPYFPTIKHIHIYIEQINKTDCIEVFPNVTSIICNNEETKSKLSVPTILQSKVILLSD